MEQGSARGHGDENAWAQGLWTLADAAGAPDPLEMDFVCPVSVRVSPDDLHVQALLQPDALHAPVEMLVALVREQCAELHADLPLSDQELARMLQGSREGEWVTLASGTAPVPPVDGGIELVVPLSIAPEPGWGGRGRRAVRAHSPLARVRRGTSGVPGRDVRGNEIAVRPPRAARLPRGEKTYIGADGTVLLASCDGEAVLRGLQVHVVPLLVLDGETVDAACPLTLDGDVFVRDSLDAGRSLTATGHVHVEGDVCQARVVSTAGRVSVGGSIVGEAHARAYVEAATEIAAGTVLHALLRAGGDVRLYEARHSAVEAGGSLHLRRTIEDSLHEVALRLAGGVVAAAPPAPDAPAPTIRQHFRVPANLEGEIAVYSTSGPAPLTFTACTIEDLSIGGARCRLIPPVAAGASPQARVQIKVSLPDGRGQIVVIGRVVRRAARHVVGIAFEDVAQHDRARLSEYCLALAQVHPDALLGTPDDRRGL